MMMLDKFIHQTLKIPFRLAVRHDRRARDEKMTLVFWHGIAASSRSWTKLLAAIESDPDFDRVRLVSVDLLGYGHSPKPRWSNYTMDDYLRSLRRTIKRLRIKTPLVLVGHSMGSLLAVEYASAYPDQEIAALALASPPLLQPMEQRAMRDRLYRKIYDKLLNAAQIKQLDVAAKWFAKMTSLEIKESRRVAFRASMKNVILGGRAFTEMKSLSLPIYIFHGSLDPLVNAKNVKTVARHKNVRLHTSATGHEIVGAKKKQLIKILKKLVEENV